MNGSECVPIFQHVVVSCGVHCHTNGSPARYHNHCLDVGASDQITSSHKFQDRTPVVRCQLIIPGGSHTLQNLGLSHHLDCSVHGRKCLYDRESSSLRNA